MSQIAVAQNPRRRRRPLALFLLFAAVMAFVAILAPRLAEDDASAIAFERSWRRAHARLGLALPGTPDLTRFSARLAEQGFAPGAPVLVRIFKREFELEIWLRRDGRFARFATYPVCSWSGALGPKLRQGDRQAPEGFYTVDAAALNPASRWHRSFNLGFPNAFDRAHGRTGSFLMVHGGCSSIGCFAMTNAAMDEIWQLVTAALGAGQRRFQVQVFPFRMSEENLARRADHPAASFWRQLKAGHDLFEATGLPPRASVCLGRYTFAAGPGASDGSGPIANACAGKGARGAG
jgi:murein L,D-transpeptidase YafK